MLTTDWQRLRITGTLTGGQTGLWIVVRQFAGNGDNWTSGSIYLWGASLQQGNDPKTGYARTWASQTTNIAAGIASGSVVISAKDNTESPHRISDYRSRGRGSLTWRPVHLPANRAWAFVVPTSHQHRITELRSL
jgi:hypothetical protein